MYGLLSFRFLSVIRQTFWGLQYPFITIKITLFYASPADRRSAAERRELGRLSR
jgi:hypothetical protein